MYTTTNAANIITSIPINGYSEFMTGLLGENWSQIFMVPYRMSYGIMSIYVVVGIARSLAHFYKVDTRESIVVSFIAISFKPMSFKYFIFSSILNPL